ncbi:hypothetical protein [Kineothrix sedimenti]|uniref:Uncharacterized protein n=1 Tax=Kineothrix sedimenti TaxID=3123317 RepID=A0ABZ3EUE2_9FIRM
MKKMLTLMLILLKTMQSTAYSSSFVSLVDKFGMRWELMTEQTEK